ERADEAVDDPDFSQVFATLRNPETGGISRIAHTGVSLAEVISGINREDTRLRDAVLSIARNGSKARALREQLITASGLVFALLTNILLLRQQLPPCL